MPQFRQGAVGSKIIATLTPLAAARAGTVNDAGGFVTDIDAHGYKSVTLIVEGGVVGTSADCLLNASATSGGSYAPITGGAIAQQTSGPFSIALDVVIPVGKPWLQIVNTNVGATTATCVVLLGHGPMVTNQP